MADGGLFFYFLDLLMSSEEDTLEEITKRLLVIASLEYNGKRQAVPKMVGYVENVVPSYSLDDFRYHYRLSRGSFEQLLAAVGPHLTSAHAGGAVEVEISKQLLIFIWYMSTPESMREIAHQFGIAKSTTHSIIYRLMNILCTHVIQIIQWPDEQHQQAISDEIHQQYHVPGVIGYIDGTHIRLSHCPSGDQDFINRKGFPSMLLQVVVDGKMRIIHAYVGWPGCTHDARVLRNSGLFQKAEAGNLFAREKFIIGDSAYPVKQWLMTPFKDNGRLRQEQRRFNRKMSSMRQIVERTIGHIKCRFRRLRCLHLYDVEAICKVIVCGCIFHNICVLTGDELDDFIESDPDLDVNNYQHVMGNAAEGLALRDRLMALLN